MKYFLYISAPFFFCLALSSSSVHAQAPACDSLAYFTWSAQCNSMTFTPNYVSPTVSYSWTFGDGGTSTAATPTHLYPGANAPGTYIFSVNLSVVSGACMDDTTIMVMVTIPANGGVPTSSIALPANPDLCAPAAITFAYPPSVVTGNGPGTSYTYIVQTGCELPDTTIIPHTSPFTPFTYTFLRSSCDPLCTVPGASPGSFRVIMVATNSCGTTRDTLEVRIASEGTLGFTAPTVAFAGDQVCLADTSSPGYAWNPTTQMCGNAKYWEIMPPNFNIVSGTLGNVNTPGSSNPCIRFTQAGTYMVSQIRPAGACPGETIKKTITVKPPCDSLANFTSNVTCNSVTFTPTFIIPSASYTWNFGDGSSSNEISPAHIYLTQNNTQYTVLLTVVDTVGSANCIDEHTATVSVIIPAGGLPIASMMSLGIGFTLKENFLHCNGSNFNPDYDLNVENTSTNTSPTTQYIINWGDGSLISMPSPFGTTNHVYMGLGLYNIVLIAVNENGCADTAHYPFFHGRVPVVGFGPSQSVDLCAPVTVEFAYTDPVINFNPPGTIYTYEIETECLPTETVVIPHTNPFTPLVYTFTRGSCEPECEIMDIPGSFRVLMTASNGCGESSQPYLPNISKIGNSDYDMPSQACIGDSVCLINASDTSYYWTSSNDCSTEMYSFWRVSPNTGFTVTKGILGDLNSAIVGTDEICFNFSVPGLYDVSMVRRPLPSVIGSPCPYDTITKTICILPQPIANFNFNQSQPSCAPSNSTITFNNSSNTLGNCRPATYTWEVEFIEAECDTVGGYTFINNTNANSTNPTIRFDLSGRYLIRLIVENDCGIDTTTREVTFGGTPFASIVPIDDACGSLMVTPTVESTNSCNGMPPNFQWIIQNPITSIFDTLMVNEIPGALDYNIPGTYIIRLTAIGGCGNSTSSDTFTIHPIPAPPQITSNTPVCQGQCLTITVQNPSPIFEYIWETPCDPPGTVNTANVLICPAEPSCTGLYQLTITDPSSTLRCSLMVNTSALVYDAPPFNLQLDTIRLCSGESGTIQVINGQPGYTYQWSPGTLLDTTAGPVVIVNDTVVIIQTVLNYTVTVTEMSNNCFDTAVATVIFNPLPIVAISPPGTACAGQPLPLFDTNNQTGTWLWTSDPIGPVFFTPTSNPTTFTGTPGTYLVKYVFIDTNGCSDSTFTNVCVQPQPIAQFTASTLSGCISSLSPSLQVSTNNSSNSQNTCGTTTYNWQVLFDGAECHNGTGIWNFEMGSSDTSLNPVINFEQSGVYLLVLTVTNECGSSSDTSTVTVGEAPQGLAIDSIGNACDTLFLIPTGQALSCNAPGLTITWFLDNTLFLNPPGIGEGIDGLHTVTMVATNVCGSDTVSTDFTIHPLPPVPVVTYNGPLCERDSLVFTVSSPTGPNFEYCWMGPNGLDTCVTDSFLIIPNATPANAGLYTVTVRDLSTVPACSASATIVVVVNPAPPIIFQTDTVGICSGQSGIIQVINGQVGYTFQWSPDNLLDTTVGPLVTVTPGTVTAVLTQYYTVTVTDALTCTNSDSALVIVNPLPVLAIAPPDTACAGVQLPLSATVSQLGVGVWTSDPAGPVFDTTTSNPSFFLTSDTGTYTIRYVFTDINGCIDSAFTSICVQPQPIAQFDISQSSNCISSMSPTLQVTTNNTSNSQNTCGITTYNWQVLFDGAECHNGTGIWNFEMGSSDTSLNPVINFEQSGVYLLVLTVTNECGSSSDTSTVTVGEAPQGLAIDSIGNACDTLFLIPTGQALSCNAPGLTITWFLDNTLFLNPPGIGEGIDGLHTVTMVATNVCGSDTVSTDFTIHPLPPVPVVTYNGPLCERDSLVFTVSSPTGPNFEYCWMGPNGLDTCVTDSFLIIPNATPANAGLYTVTVRDLSTVPACSASATIVVVVNPAPPIIFQTDTVGICSGQSGIIQVINGQVGYTFQWSPDNLLDTTVGPLVTVTPGTVTAVLTQYYTVTVTDALTCTNSDSALVIVNPLPVLAIAPPDTACAGVQLPLSATVSQLGVGVWTSDPAGPVFDTTTSNPSFFLTSDTGTYTIRYVFTDINGCIDSAFTSICVQPQPIAQFDISQSSNCISSMSPTLQVTTNNTSNTQNTCGITTYNWQVLFDTSECDSGPGIWNFEPGSSDTSLNPVINFGQSGVYRLVLNVDNECGTSSTTATVTVGEAPQITSFATTDPVVCEPYILNPMADVLSCNSPITSYLWSFPGSSGIQSSTVLNPGPIPYNVPGNYTVNFVVTNVCGVDSEAHTFQVQALPSITATASNTTGCVPVVATFSNQPVAGVTYVWDFGDGSSTVTTPNPGSHTYNNPGTYTITITATDAFGCSRTSTLATVQANPVPIAGFTLAPTLTCGIPQTLCLTNIAVGNLIYTWTFVPNIGPIPPIANPCVTITAEGDYVIQQLVRNQFGCVDSTTLTYTAYDQPVASFEAVGDSSGCEDLLIQFDNLSEHADFVEWQIDGQVVTLDPLNPSYLFTDPGEYTVTLTVGNGSGCTASLTRNAYIRVFPTPVAGFEFVPLPNEWPVTFRFRDKSSSDAILFGWNFGEIMDTVDSEEKNPKYRYFSTADRLITHWVTNAFGCSDTITAPLSIDVDGDLFIPNILEPANSDHPEMQIFLPKGYNLAEYHIAVFARTGQLIWESTLLDVNGHPVESWDGTLNGSPLPSGVFVWKVIKAVFINRKEWDGMLDENKVKRKTNFLYLIR